MNAVPHCHWSVSKRYNYFGVDLYYYPCEYTDVAQDPESFIHESWFERASGPVYAGTRKDAEKVAKLLNDAYWRGVNVVFKGNLNHDQKEYPF